MHARRPLGGAALRTIGASIRRSAGARRGGEPCSPFATTRVRRSTSSGSTAFPRTRCTVTFEPTASSTRTERSRNPAGSFALAHFGSWDVAAGCGLASGLHITTVMAPVGTDLVTRIAAWARRRQDLEVLVSSNAARGLVRAVRRGRFAAILSDIPDRGETVLVDFCGGEVAFSTAASWLGRVAHVPVMPVECWRIGGLYRLVVHPPVAIQPDDTDAEVMQGVATGLEAAIRRAPEWWYPFGDVYRTPAVIVGGFRRPDPCADP